MDNNWRGRGRGRGAFNNNRNNNTNAFNNNNQGNSSILSRLGRTNVPLDENANNDNNYNNRSHNNNFNDHRNNNNNYNDRNNSNNYNDRNNNSNYNDRNNGHSQQYNNRGGRTFSSSNNYRGRGRGYKNTSGERFNKEFMDEDIDMNKPETNASNVVTVTGFPPGSGDTVLPFLQRKSKTSWEPINIQQDQNSVIITVANDKLAGIICRMNNYDFRGAKLHISQGQGQPQTQSQNTTNTMGAVPSGGQPPSATAGKSKYLADFLNDRWDPQSGYLSLDDLPPTENKISTVFAKLLDDAKFYYGDNMKTFSACRDRLWSVAPLRKLPDFFPNLQNLSLEGNEIAEFRSLDVFANKFPQLKELVLIGNPIQQTPSYQQEILKRFPSLQSLDFQPIGGGGSSNSMALPVPVRSNFFDQESTSMVAQDLLSKYFPMFDSNRASLGDLYDAQSVFSCVFSNGNFQQQNAWGSNQVPPSQRMVIGSDNIVKRFAQLPGTLHDLSSAENFMTDAWQTQGSQAYPVVIFLNVHGEFSETPMGARLSFDRAFLVAPSTPGSRAQIAGWSYVILSDSLVVRQFSCKPASLVTA